MNHNHLKNHFFGENYPKEKNKMTSRYLSILIAIMVLLLNTGCERNLPLEKEKENQIKELKTEKKTLQKKLDESRLINSELGTRVAELSVDDPGGLAIEEKRKSLTDQETDIQRKRNELLERESFVEELEKSIREQSENLATEKRQFIIENTDMIQGIGKAHQMRETYDDLQKENKLLRKERSKSENRANKWLVGIAILTFLVFCIIIISVIYLYRYKIEEKKINAIINLRDSDIIPIEAKRLIDASLGRSLNYDD